ncbi:MAG: Zn-ribbon domain-containing OB-fold protein [Candidatus Hydrothermarchaeales archaeon]
MSIPRFWRNTQSRYNLVGTRCGKCNEAYFPPKRICPKCRRQSQLEKTKFAGTGEIVSYTVIHAAPEGFEKETPYVMAIVKLDEGPMLTTQIVDCDDLQVKIGMHVKSVFRKIREDGKDGLIYYGYKFKPVSGPC